MTSVFAMGLKAEPLPTRQDKAAGRLAGASQRAKPRSRSGESAGVDAAMVWRFDKGEPTLSLSEQIASRVAERILGEVKKPAERILEQQLAAEFRVSRGPVREALRILEREGLVEIIPRHGAQVTALSVTEVKNIFDIRASLLGLAARLAAQRKEPQTIAALAASIEKLARAAQSHIAYLQASYETSLLLAAASGSERLRAMISSLALQTFRYTRLGLSTAERRTQSLRNWRNLAKALKEGYEDEAERLARQLVADSRDTAMALLGRRQKNP